MERIRIAVEPSYDVIIGENLLIKVGELIAAQVPACRAAVITDSNVGPLYLDKVRNSLHKAGFTVASFVFSAGEQNKTMDTLSAVLEFLAENQLTRTDLVIALGGGVVGDVTGFAAGCYLRGVRFVQIPTTLLAAVDSSVGGKTAVDLSAGKNLAGLFWQPAMVICDTTVLRELPEEIFAEGAAEALKTGVLSGEALFSLCESGIRGHLEAVVAGCVKHKGSVVEQDERESGLRKTLNLGHTPAHAIERLSGYGISHGRAVAIGLALMAATAEKMGDAPAGFYDRICSALKAAGLPVESPYSPDALAKAAVSDKKRTGDRITVAVPKNIGSCELRTISINELEKLFAAGMEGQV